MYFLQRGTGLSTALTPSSMSQLGSAEEVAEYVTNFRADNIVKDAEFIRIRLVPDAGPWVVLGQVLVESQLLTSLYLCYVHQTHASY